MKFRQEISLPAPAGTAPFYTPDCFYLIGQLGNATSDTCEIYVTDNDGNIKKVGNTPMIEAIVTEQLATVGSINIVATYGDLPAATSATANEFYLVQDASGDSTVDSGAAMYVLNAADDTFTKVHEFESLSENLSLDWSQVANGPSSTPAQIDSTVTNSHTHANRTAIDPFSFDGNNDLTHNGSRVAVQVSNNW
ncbi:hypothetical protein OAB00_01230 [Akkermansiaceae bacterium]|nr:hypothetical protein [Akkermansiaceae bacterium]